MKQQPNVIWIFGDQHRAQALGYRGDPNVKTPCLDRLASRGLRFDNAVAGSPWCTPFRAALFTGRYPHQVGCTKTPAKLDPEIPTIAQPFREAGYHTALVGKWHLGGSNSEHVILENERGGFDYWMGFETGNTTFDTLIHGTDEPELRALPGFHTDELTDLFTNHLRKHVTISPDKPFFGVLSVRPPHDPYESPPPFDRINKDELKLRPNVPDVSWVREKATREIVNYYGMIENLDWNVGRILQALNELGIADNTWIMFFSDHGDSHGSHALFQKSNPYEESIRIPLICACASMDDNLAGRISDAVVNHVDLAPTTLGLCGIKPPDWMCGHDYSNHVLHENPVSLESEPSSALLQQVHPKSFPAGIDTPWRGVVTRDGWKYVCTPGERWLMFNLNEDPFEQANLVFNSCAIDKRKYLHGILHDWLKRTGDHFSLPSVQP